MIFHKIMLVFAFGYYYNLVYVLISFTLKSSTFCYYYNLVNVIRFTL